MTEPPARAPGASDPGLGFRAFVALMAALMAINALGIDIMLAALPQMARSLKIPHENQQQWVIVAYVLGFGVAQIFWGPLADRYGRKPIVVASTMLFGVLSFVAGVAATFPLLLAARMLQGIAAASSRVLVVSIVRDCYDGRQMARVMSLALICFLAVPILAPSIGQAILLLTGSWRWIFFALGLFGLFVAGMTGWKLKETLHPEYRRPASLGGVLTAMARVVRDRTAIGYTICSALMYGSLTSFINSVGQIFGDIFHAPQWFPPIFACIAAMMGLSAFINSRVVGRFGTRRVSQTAMFGFAILAVIHLAIALSGHETMLSLALVQAGAMFCFGMMGSNFGSMAMEPVGDIAGTASSVQGFLSTCLGALVGFVIGQSFDGTTVPLAAGYTAIGLGVIAVVFVTERGKLFRPHHLPVI